MENKDLSPEEKKAAALQAKKEAAEKAKAQKQEKAAATKKANDELKAQAAQEKGQKALEEAGVKFTELQGVHATVGTQVASLNAESTVEQVQLVVAGTTDAVKSAKALAKEIAALASSNKSVESLAQASTSAAELLKQITDLTDPLKTKVAEAKKAAKEREKAEAKVKREEEKAANAQPQQNGITRPRPDTACGQCWALFDAMSAKMGAPVPVAYALQAAESKGLNKDTAKTQYARWKTFNGITGRVATPMPAGLLD